MQYYNQTDVFLVSYPNLTSIFLIVVLGMFIGLVLYVISYILLNDLRKRVNMLEIKVYEIKGFCAVYKKGDRILVDGPEIVLDKTDALCTHALSTILHYTTILEHNWCPVKLGLTTKKAKDCAYLQCVDPGEPYTNGGTVIFQCRKVED